MSGFATMVRLQAQLILYLLVGGYARKRKILTDAARQGLVDLLVRVTLPCAIFQSFHQEITVGALFSMAEILLVSFVVCLFSILLGKLLYRSRPPGRRSVLRYGTLISNSSFAGLPVVQHLYGSLGLLFGAVFVIPNRIFMWSAGISMFTEADRKTKLKNVLGNPGILAVLLGGLRMLLRVPFPAFLDDAIGNVGGCTTVLAMVVVGAILADVPLKSIWDGDALLLSFVRLLALPLLLLGFMRLLGCDRTATAVGVLMTGMPVGSTCALLAERYGGDSAFGARCIFLSTVLSTLTAPLLALLLSL